MVTTSAIGAQVTEALSSRDLSEDTAYVLSLCFQEGNDGVGCDSKGIWIPTGTVFF